MSPLTRKRLAMDYYSARLLVVCLVDDGKPRKKNVCGYPFVVFRARNPADAFKRALDLGRQQETTYKNDKGQGVRWAFVKVETIERLGRSIDGREIGSLLDVLNSEKPVPFEQRFQPSRQRPLNR